jgi:hypothetical protein
MPWPCAFFAAMYSGLCAGKKSLACGVAHSFGKARCGKFSDISKNRDIWPVLCEDFPAIGVDFAERDSSHSGSLEPEAEAANS